jgi:putative FmdB family regulatory protein
MPLYEYRCKACGSTFEKIRKYSDEPVEVCDKCGKGPVQKLISSPAIQFKGTGWYITDYARKSTTDSGSSKSSSDKSDKSEKSDKSDKSGKSDKGESTTKNESAAKSSDTPKSSKE